MDGINLSNVDLYKSTPHSNFDLSFSRKFDGKFGDIHPVLCLPVMPDDTISLSHSVMLRMAPFIQQVFQDYNVVMGYYYVPNRVLWHNFSKFLTGGSTGKVEYVHPYIDLNNVPYAKTSLPYGWLNLFDVPRHFCDDKSFNQRLNALPFAAYCRVLLDYFLPQANTALSSLREEFNQEQLLRDGDNTAPLLNLLLKLATCNPNASMSMVEATAAYGFDMPQCLYPLDYFTSARPETQHGPAMTIPVRLVNTDANGVETFVPTVPLPGAGTSTTSSVYFHYLNDGQNGQLQVNVGTPSARVLTVNGSVFNNVATINEFYEAARIQELFSLYGYAGLTSDDKIAAEFGVQNPNTSLQRAQLLGYDTLNVGIGEVFSSDVTVNGSSDSMIPGAGTAVGKLNQGGNGFRARFAEHGYIIGVCFCYPEAAYEDGLPRYLRLSDRFDYPHPLFANIGMQSIKREEICVTGTSEVDRGDFAYTSRYGDYKVGVNRVNGALQTSLSSMVAGRKLENDGDPLYVYPQFNDRFLRVDPAQNRLNRTFNVLSDLPTDKPLFFDVKFKIDAYRPLPYYGLPKF